MWVALFNAITSGLTGVAHYFVTMPASQAVLWTTFAYFVVKKAPVKIPIKPQDFWTWGRDAAQGYVSTRTGDSPPNPTQPAPPVQEQPKPTA